jgi:hypothetical protein
MSCRLLATDYLVQHCRLVTQQPPPDYSTLSGPQLIVSVLEHIIVKGEVEMYLPSFLLCRTPRSLKKPRGNTRDERRCHLQA